jgi:hypothetical protein
MAGKLKLGGGFIGLLFLGVGVLKFLQGNDWIVWIILGVLLGGLSAFSGKEKGADES